MGAVTVVVLFVLISATVFAGTTIGTNITTTGTLAVSNNADFTLGGTKRIFVDAATTDTTLPSTGVVDLRVDAAANNVIGISTTLALQGSYSSTLANYAAISSASDLASQTGPTAYYADLQGRNSATSVGGYTGFGARTSGSTNNADTYFGLSVAFTSDSGGGIDLTGNGNANGAQISIQKTSGTGTMRGVHVDLNSKSSSSTTARGIEISMDVSGGAAGDNAGIQITEDGASGTLLDGVEVIATNIVTDGFDASSANITNALNVGQNTILSSGDFMIDLKTGANSNLTINNTQSGFDASLILDGGLAIGSTTTNPGTKITKHLSGTATNLASLAIANATCGDYGAITVTGAAVGDTVYASPDATSSSTGIEDYSLIWNAVVTSGSTVTIRACNLTGAPINAGDDQEWRADVWQH